MGFFQALQSLEFLSFTPTQLLADGDTVVALLNLEARVRGGSTVVKEIDEVHIWRFDPGGRVASFRHRVDTRQHAALAAEL
jgi:hypothetical protein